MINDEEYQNLIDKYDCSYKENEHVKGIVCGFEGNNLLVDIKSKALAVVNENEIVISKGQNVKELFEIGKEYEFIVNSLQDEDGVYKLSHKKIAIYNNLEELKKKFENDETVTGTVTNITKGGALVNVMGIKGFVPSSHLKENNINVKDTLELKILSIDLNKNNFILSNKKVYMDSMEEVRKEVFDKIEVNMVVKGEVVRLTDFGAFIDIGGVDGLLPLSQMSWNWIDNPADILKLNDKIDVEIIGIDKDKQRISLSIKSLEENPWLKALETTKENSKVKGKVTRVKPFGAFVEIYPKVEGLLNKAQVKAIQNNLQRPLIEGDEIEIIVKKFDIDNKKIIFDLP